MRKLPARQVMAGVLPAALVACNVLLGNENGTSREAVEAGVVQPGATSSGSGSGSSSGTSLDASAPDGAPAPSTCPGGETNGFCDPLPLAPSVIPGAFNTSEFQRIAANDAYLFVTSNDGTTLRFGLDENDAPDGFNGVSVNPPLRLATTPLARFGVPDADNPLFDAPSSLRRCSSGGPPACTGVDDTTSASHLVPATGGVLAIRTTPSGLIYTGGSSVTPLESLDQLEAGGMPVTANGDTAFFVSTVSGVVRSVKRCRYLPDKQEKAPLRLDVLENPSFLAANDELLFFSPCGSNAVCAVDARVPDGTTTSTVIVGASATQAGVELFVDATRLVVSDGAVTSICNTSACELRQLIDAPMKSATRNSRSLFVLAGSSIWRAKRTPLRPPP